MTLTGEQKSIYMKRYYIENKDRIKIYNWKKYGVKTNDWDKLLLDSKQATNCDICGAHKSKLKGSLHVDHSHITGEVRGWLCSNCNTGIGLLKTINVMKAAIKYLNGE